ncbi:MAG: hypothetical protein JWN43_3191, partial [Gammaproteobacteria bacterium]|nr:hypothetical protein [Gammaproteobacteria bacterium]
LEELVMNANFIRRCRLLPLLAIILASTATAPVFAVAPLVNATLEPRQIAVGETAELTITSSGNGMEGLTLPQVAGLEFRLVGQSRRIQLINGATLATTSIVLRITPEAAGIYIIPGITPKSQPLVLRVNPDSGTGGSSSYGNSNSAGRPPPGSSSSSSGIRMTPDGSAFIRLVLPKHELYVGESIPVDIEVGLRNGFARLNGIPTLTGADFTLNNLSGQPERADKVIDGKPFTVLAWHSVIAAVKPGKFTLAMESPFTVRIRTRPQRESMLDDLLGDPFLQNFFGATVQKDITASSPPSELTVSPLPPEGRPPDFTGAVGTFKIASDISAPTAAAGDPLTLRMHVTGAGNFDRVDSTMLERLDQWKTYPPRSTFKPSDPLGYKGEKTFEQPVIASKPGTQTLPGLTFSYFDPSTHRYETARSAPLSVTIAPSAADASLAAAQSPAPAQFPPNAPAPPGAPANPSSDGLRPDHPASGTGARSLVPLYWQPRFLAIPSVLALAFAGAWLGLRRADPADTRRARGRRTSKMTHRSVQDMEAAARAGNAALFFKLARTALLGSLAARWRVAPERLAPTEFDARLGSESEDIRRIFALADEADYSGHEPAADLERWMQVVRHELLTESPA